MLVVDSSIWIDFFRGTATPECDFLRTLLRRPDGGLVVPDLVLFEVLRGFRDEAQCGAARKAFHALRIEPVGGETLALRAVQRWRELRQQGWTVRSTVDAFVASFCIEHDLVLLHRDRDFDAYATHFGLRTWSQPSQMN